MGSGLALVPSRVTWATGSVTTFSETTSVSVTLPSTTVSETTFSREPSLPGVFTLVVPSYRESSFSVFFSKGIFSVSVRSTWRTRCTVMVAPSVSTESRSTEAVSVSSISPSTARMASSTVRAVTSKVSWPYWPTKVTVLRVTTSTSVPPASSSVAGSGVMRAPSAA